MDEEWIKTLHVLSHSSQAIERDKYDYVTPYLKGTLVLRDNCTHTLVSNITMLYLRNMV